MEPTGKGNKKTARIAGLWYLLFVIFGSFSTMYVDSVIYVPEDATTTVNNLLTFEWLFRFGFVSCLAGYVCFLFLANVLYKLFKQVDSDFARLMVLFVIVGVSVATLNKLNQFVAVLFLNGADYLSAFEPSQLKALVMSFLKMYKQGEMITTIFWGLWLLPLGLLVLKSNFIPKALGVLLMIACFSHLLNFFAYFFYPNYTEVVDSVLSTAAFGEILFFLWLLIKGVKVHKSNCAEINYTQK